MSVYTDYKLPNNSGGYLKIEDGQSLKLRIVSEPVVFENEFKGNLSTRYAWVVWNMDEEIAQAWVGNVTFYRSIANLAQDEDWGDPKTYAIKVKREGTGTDTKYHVTPVALPEDQKLTDGQRTEIAKVDLIKAISAAPSAQHVAWLSDVVEQMQNAKAANTISGGKMAVGEAMPPATASDKFNDLEPLDDKSLSDIPF
jgi:hypothetical protein